MISELLFSNPKLIPPTIAFTMNLTGGHNEAPTIMAH
jgi:hypothetical protein